MSRRWVYAVAAVAIAIVASAYWPVVHANFVWIDWVDFHDRAWLREGDQWKHYIFRDFNTWTNYFRPLVVGLFTLQVRLFDVRPEPMHAVSLAMHLVNTMLVGLLSWRCADAATSQSRKTWLLGACMLLYGLHPVLIEPVAWIGCQFELMVTMLTLLALLANVGIRGTSIRAVVVASLFFLAACAKESAVSLPLILVIFDWMLLPKRDGDTLRSATSHLILRNWLVYAAMFFAGVLYLIFRHWALGKIVNPFPRSSISMLGHLQETCFLYLHYWETLVWPASGMSPIHPIDESRFHAATASSMLIDAIAIGTLAAGLLLALRRSSVAGCMVLAVTASLLPVLHIASVDFDTSLYHERYVMTALAVVCVMLPRLQIHTPSSRELAKLTGPLMAAGLLFWLFFALINIRVTLPLWSNNVNLWRWTLAQYPDSVIAKDNLLNAYLDARDYANADLLIDQLLTDHVQCANCMLNAAIVAIKEHDPARAATELEVVRNSRELTTDKQMFRVYLLTTGQMLALQGHLTDAEAILRAAVKLDPFDPYPQLSLATALALQGRKDQARKVGEIGIALLVPEERDPQREMLDKAIAAGAQRLR